MSATFEQLIIYIDADSNIHSAEDAQGTAKSYLQYAQNTASDLANKAQQNAPANSGEAQEGAKTYLETAQGYAANAAKTVSNTISGQSTPSSSHCPSRVLTR